MARTAKTAAPNNTELSNALTRAEKAETALADALRQLAEMTAAHEAMVANRNKLFAEREDLVARLTLARKLYVEMRAALPVTKPVSAAKAAYNARATAGRIAFAKATEARAKNAKAFFAAHPDVKSATDSEIAEWVEAQGEATV